MKTQLFFGGIPTDIELKKLCDHWPETQMSIGDQFTYDEIATIISVRKKTTHLRTITNRWRKHIEALTGQILGPFDGKGLKVLSDSEKFSLRKSKTKSARKYTLRSIEIGANINLQNLSLVEREEDLRINIINGNIIASMQLRQKLEAPTM